MKNAIFTGMMVVLWLGIVFPMARLTAQDNSTIDVQVVITGVTAKNLNEDTPLIDDGEDEMEFVYGLYEVDRDGRVLQSVSATTGYNFNVGERASGAEFETLALVAATDSRVYFLLQAFESDTSISDEDAQKCGAGSAFAVAQCLFFGDCFGLLNPNILVDCLSDLGVTVVGTSDDWFERTHLQQILVDIAPPQLNDINLRDDGRNSALYEVEYTVLRTATTAPSVRNEAIRYLLVGRLEDSAETQTWPIALGLGDTITVRMSPFSGDLDAAVALLDADGNVLARNDNAEGFNTTNALLQYDLRLDGTYTIRAERGDGDTSGDFVVEVLVE